MSLYTPRQLRLLLAREPDRFVLNALLPGASFSKDEQGKGEFVAGDAPDRPLDLVEVDFSRTKWKPGCRLLIDARRSMWDEALLEACNLTGSSFTGASFWHTQFIRCALANITFSACQQNTNGSIQGGTFRDIQAIGSSWKNWTFRDVDLVNIDFRHSVFEHCIFVHTRLEHINWSHCEFYQCDFRQIRAMIDLNFQEAKDRDGYSQFPPADIEQVLPGWPKAVKGG